MSKINIPITDKDTLIKFYDKCVKEKVLAIDTEFIRDNTYYPCLCLIQIAGSNFSAAIDPLSNLDLTPIWKLLSNEKILKVFHAGRQDIEIFFYLTGEIPKPIYDTQIASMFCGFGDQVGYEHLVKNFLGITINKEYQFTNWFQRPLSKKQIEYAISDVTHLTKIYPLIKKLIENINRQSWVEKETSHLYKKELYNTNPEEAWKKIKIKNSNPKMLNLLKHIAAWRENECKKRNIPRNKLIRDDVLINISYSKPSTINEFKKIRGVTKNFSETDSNAILDVIKTKEKLLPKTFLFPKKSKKSNSPKGSLDLLKLLLKYCSEESGLAEKLIANNDDLRSILDGEREDLKVFTGWRNEIFGNFVILLLEGKLAFTLENNKVKKINI